MHPMDILEFVDTSYNSCIKNLHEFVESYEILFLRTSSNLASSPSIEDESKERCKHYLEDYLLDFYSNYIGFVHDLFQSKYYGQDDDTQLYVRAIDRFLRRSSNDIYKYLFTQHAIERIRSMLDQFLLFAIECRLKFYHAYIDRHFHDQIIELRKSLTLLQSNTSEQSHPSSSTSEQQPGPLNLTQCVDKMIKQLTNDIKHTFQSLSTFLDGTEMIGNIGKKNAFAKQFASTHVWTGFFLTLLNRLITYFEHEYTTASSQSNIVKYEQSSPPILLLMLSKLILNFDSSSIPYLCTVFEEKFNLILENTQRGRLVPVAVEAVSGDPITKRCEEFISILPENETFLKGVISWSLLYRWSTESWIIVSWSIEIICHPKTVRPDCETITKTIHLLSRLHTLSNAT